MALWNLFSISKCRKVLLIVTITCATAMLFYHIAYATISSKLLAKYKTKLPNSMSTFLIHTSNLNVTQTLSSSVDGNVWTVHAFNASNENKDVQESVNGHQCVQLRTSGDSAKICVHPVKVDVYVSGSLIRSGMWEGDLVHLTADSIKKHPGMVLLDLGCNIGTFTIYCAKLGTRVVSVDASKENLLLLSRSLALNHFEDRVTLFWNALSDVHENVILKGYPENKGGTYVRSSNLTDSTQVVKTITLDDLIPTFKNQSIFIKMDLETYEWRALNGGHQFFKSVRVGYVLMEFSSHRKVDSGQKICEFMSGFGFKPYGADTKQRNKILNITQYSTWPNNVLWSKV